MHFRKSEIKTTVGLCTTKPANRTIYPQKGTARPLA